MKKLLLAGLAAGLMLGMTGLSNASLITFEDQENTVYNAPISRLGFDIGNPTGQEQHFHEITSTSYGLPNNGTGILLNDRNTEIFVNEISKGTFILSGVDVASSINNFGGLGLDIRGYLGNDLVGTINVANLGTGWTSISGSTLGTIDKLVFDGFGEAGGFCLDNLELTKNAAPVPEPATMLLFGTGIASLAAIGRRKRR